MSAAHLPVPEAQYAADHAALLLLDDARALGLADEHPEFLFGYGVVAFGA